MYCVFFFFSSRRRHTRCSRDWSSDVCSSDLSDLDHDQDRWRFCNGVHVICVSATAPTAAAGVNGPWENVDAVAPTTNFGRSARSEEHTSELQSRLHLVCRLLLEKKKKQRRIQ